MTDADTTNPSLVVSHTCVQVDIWNEKWTSILRTVLSCLIRPRFPRITQRLVSVGWTDGLRQCLAVGGVFVRLAGWRCFSLKVGIGHAVGMTDGPTCEEICVHRAAE